MPTLHELEKRADRHRKEALKKIEAREQQEQPQVGPQDTVPEAGPELIDKIEIRRNW